MREDKHSQDMKPPPKDAMVTKILKQLQDCVDSNQMAGVLQTATKAEWLAVRDVLLSGALGWTDTERDFGQFVLQLATAYDKAGDPAIGIPLAEALVRKARDVHDIALLPTALGTLGLLQMHSGRLNEARRTLNESVTSSTLADDHYSLLRAHINLAIIESDRGEEAKAIARLKQTRDLAIALGDPRVEGLAEENMRMSSRRALGKLLTAGPTELAPVLASYNQSGIVPTVLDELPTIVDDLLHKRDRADLVSTFNSLSRLGIGLLQSGLSEQACDAFGRAHLIAATLNMPQQAVESLLNQASASAQTAADQRTRSLLQSCLSQSRKLGLARAEAGCLLTSAGLNERRGDQETARADYRSALDITSRHSLDDFQRHGEAGIHRLARTRSRAHRPDPEDRHLRIFVSSTFQDMKREREILAKVVFPRIRRLCTERQIMLSEIDLRWGITDQQVAEGNAAAICLEHISCRRPVFLCMLGDRYGSVVGHNNLPAVIERYPWVGNYPEISITELEIRCAALNTGAASPYGYFYFKQILDHPHLTQTSVHFGERARLNTLKDSIQRSCTCIPADKAALAYIHERGTSDTTTSAQGGQPFALRIGYSSPEQFAALVERDLAELVNELYPPGSKMDALSVERQDHRILTRQHLRGHVTQSDRLAAIEWQLRSQKRPVVVSGPPGSGKSALLTSWFEDRREHHPEELAVIHYVGATPDSSDWRHVCHRVIGELTRSFDFESPVSVTEYDLRHAFRDALYLAGQRGRAVIVIDDLSRLDELDRLPDLSWLPAIMPDNIWLVVSAHDGPYLDELIARHWPVVETRLLTELERWETVTTYLAGFSKALSKEQLDRIVSAPVCQNPLYLRTVIDEMRLFGEYDKLWDCITSYLDAGDIVTLYERILSRWEIDYGSGIDGLVRRFMTILFCERDRGILDHELCGMLSWPGQPLPRLLIEPLRLAADSILSSRGGKLFLRNRYIWEAIRRRYLPHDDNVKAAFESIAKYSSAHDRQTESKMEGFFKSDAAGEPLVEEEQVMHLSFGQTKATVFDTAPLIKQHEALAKEEKGLRARGDRLRLAVNLFGQAIFVACEVPEMTGYLIFPVSMALEKVTEAAEIALEVENMPLYASAKGVQGLVYSKMERLEEAVDAYLVSERTLRRHGPKDALKDTLVNLGNVLSRMNRQEEAQRYYRQASTL